MIIEFIIFCVYVGFSALGSLVAVFRYGLNQDVKAYNDLLMWVWMWPILPIIYILAAPFYGVYTLGKHIREKKMK